MIQLLKPPTHYQPTYLIGPTVFYSRHSSFVEVEETDTLERIIINGLDFNDTLEGLDQVITIRGVDDLYPRILKGRTNG